MKKMIDDLIEMLATIRLEVEAIVFERDMLKKENAELKKSHKGN